HSEGRGSGSAHPAAPGVRISGPTDGARPGRRLTSRRYSTGPRCAGLRGTPGPNPAGRPGGTTVERNDEPSPGEGPMRVSATILLVIPALMGGLARPPSDRYTYLSNTEYRGQIGELSYGLATGVVVCEQKSLRPIAWFAAVKPTDGESRFL